MQYHHVANNRDNKGLAAALGRQKPQDMSKSSCL